VEVDGSVLLVRPSVIICSASGELGSRGSVGGNELMVISAPMVWEVHL
jgi:hypothetical protein